MNFLRRLFGPRRRPSPLKTELANLRKAYAAEEDQLAEIAADFWRDGGICCPGCGVPGYNDRVAKQERRLRRIDGIQKKLEHSGARRQEAC